MVWSIWSAWQGVYINPWSWALVILGIAFVWSIPWKVRVLPLTLTYILFVNVGYAYQSANFAISPSILTALLALFSFLVFCTLKEPAWRTKRYDSKIGWHFEFWPLYQPLLGFMGLVGVGLSVAALFMYSDRADGRYIMPLFWNRSVGGSFIVLALAPTALWWLGLFAAAILGRSTPLIVFAAYWFFSKMSFSRALTVAVLGSLVCWVGGIPDGTGRLDFWKTYWHYWVGLPVGTKLFGTHLGTTAALLPIAQVQQGVAKGDQIFIWLHNDFFQAYTEFGMIGFTLCALAAIEIFLRCSKKERAMALGLCVFMISDYGWHWVPEVLLFWLWIRRNAITNPSESGSGRHRQVFSTSHPKGWKDRISHSLG